MSRVLPSPSTGAEPPSGEIHTVAGSIPRGATTPATPSAGRVLEPPSLCAFAMAAKFRYKRSPNREHVALRMELHAVVRPIAVPKRHHHPAGVLDRGVRRGLVRWNPAAVAAPRAVHAHGIKHSGSDAACTANE